MTTPADVEQTAPGSRGVYPVTVTQAQAAAGSIIVSGAKRLYGWSIISGAAATSENAGQVTAPGAGATIVQVTGLPAGDYAVTWTVELIGPAAAADQNNFQLLNGVTVILASDNQPAAGNYPQPGVVITVPASGTVSIQAIGAGTAAVIYRAQLVLSLLAGGAIGNVLDGGQVAGTISTGQDGVDVQWMGDSGIYIGTSVAVLATVGKLSGCIYVADLRD